jgi:hypothetical protein
MGEAVSSEFKSAATVADFRTLDEADMLLGYMDGFDGLPPPGSGSSRSFFHGWRNGMVDAGHLDPNSAQLALAEEFSAMAPPTIH